MSNKMLLYGVLVITTVLVIALIPKNKSCNTENKSGKEQGIRFMETGWNKVLEEAKKQNKPVFLDAYASWCGPCKLLKKKTFPDKEAGEFFNSNFINAAIDMEKGEGPELGDKFNVRAYPTLIIADKDGNIISYTEGYLNPKQLIEFGKYALSKKKK